MCATNDPVFMVGQTSRVPSAVLPAPSRHSSFSNPFLHENPRREDVAGLRRGERAAQGRGDCVGRVPSGFGVRVRGASVRAGPECCAPWCPERPRKAPFSDSCSIPVRFFSILFFAFSRTIVWIFVVMYGCTVLV